MTPKRNFKKMMQKKMALIEILLACIVAGITIVLSFYNRRINDPDRLFKEYSTSAHPFNGQVWAYYLIGYQTKQHDGLWGYWGHSYDNKIFFDPPKTFPSKYYPSLGFYSSRNKTIIKKHLNQLVSIGISSIVIPFYGLQKDPFLTSKGIYDKTFNRIINIAEDFNIKISILIPSYKNRTWTKIFNDIKYFNSLYNNRKAILKDQRRPVIFIQDAHLLNDSMNTLLNIRRTHLDCYFIGTFLTYEQFIEATEDGFDALTTFYPSEDFSWASNSSNWKLLGDELRHRSVSFVASVSPGFDDSHSIKSNKPIISRNNGIYYENKFKDAKESGANIILINSFNNFIDSTLIENVIETEEFKLNDENWKDKKSNSFIELTEKLISMYKSKSD